MKVSIRIKEPGFKKLRSLIYYKAVPPMKGSFMRNMTVLMKQDPLREELQGVKWQGCEQIYIFDEGKPRTTLGRLFWFVHIFLIISAKLRNFVTFCHFVKHLSF